jgi:hypothetical protein
MYGGMAMLKKSTFSLPGTWKKGWYVLFGFGLLFLFFSFSTHVDIKGHFDGLFLLKGTDRALFELKDDLYLGDGSRLICGVDFHNPHSFYYKLFVHHKPGEAYLFYEWDPKDGSGFVRNYLPNGNQLLTCFSRFQDDDHQYAHGLFVGGGLPANVRDDDPVKMTATGMAYNDGRRWYHLWCSVNEGVASARTWQTLGPSRWRFLGSKVLNGSDNTLVLTSSHLVEIDGVPLRIERYAYFTAGQSYFLLSYTVKNVGQKEVGYFYLYGDEPWLGDYGSSAGNVGWAKDRLIHYETLLDVGKYSYAGFFDYGNDAIAEGHHFTRVADFIEWRSNHVPFVYFSNYPGEFDKSGKTRPPLSSNTRFMGLEWGPLVLKPGEEDSYALAIGMAGNDPKTGFPVKPDTEITHHPLTDKITVKFKEATPGMK